MSGLSRHGYSSPEASQQIGPGLRRPDRTRQGRLFRRLARRLQRRGRNWHARPPDLRGPASPGGTSQAPARACGSRAGPGRCHCDRTAASAPGRNLRRPPGRFLHFDDGSPKARPCPRSVPQPAQACRTRPGRARPGRLARAAGLHSAGATGCRCGSRRYRRNHGRDDAGGPAAPVPTVLTALAAAAALLLPRPSAGGARRLRRRREPPVNRTALPRTAPHCPALIPTNCEGWSPGWAVFVAG